MSASVLNHTPPSKILLCSQDEEPLGWGCPGLLHSRTRTGLGNDIARRQNPRRPRPPWESMGRVSPRPPEWLRFGVNRQTGTFVGAEQYAETHGYLSPGIPGCLITFFPTPREAEQLAGQERDRGSSRGEQSRRRTGFVELSHSVPGATPLP